MIVPKLRPPSAHSSMFASEPAGRQRAAAKPSTVTASTRTMRMIELAGIRLSSAHDGDVDREQDARTDRPRQLIPIEERHAEERRIQLVIKLRKQHRYKRNE